MRFRGKLYRALNPIHAREPMSGRGAALHGGRFNPRGVPALYASASVLTALREANQIGHLQPTTVVSYEADLPAIFDARDAAALAEHGMDASTLSVSTWRDEMRETGLARTQAFSQRLVEAGCAGLLVRSFAPGTTSDDVNVVLWRWTDETLRLINDEGRLS